jgi:hypothetical protein
MSERPVIRVIVAWWPTPDSPCIIRPREGMFTLEEGAGYAEMGFQVLADPFDLEDLTRWEQLHRSKNQ